MLEWRGGGRFGDFAISHVNATVEQGIGAGDEARAEDDPMTHGILAWERALPPWGLPVAIAAVVLAVVVTLVMALRRKK